TAGAALLVGDQVPAAALGEQAVGGDDLPGGLGLGGAAVVDAQTHAAAQVAGEPGGLRTGGGGGEPGPVVGDDHRAQRQQLVGAGTGARGDLVECAAAVVAGAELVALGVVETGEGELVAFVGGEASGVEGAAWQQRDPAPAAAPDQDREPRVLEPAQVAHHGAGGDADLSGQL